jgi:hypothetical protein
MLPPQVKALVQSKAPLQAANRYGNTPLDEAYIAQVGGGPGGVVGMRSAGVGFHGPGSAGRNAAAAAPQLPTAPARLQVLSPTLSLPLPPRPLLRQAAPVVSFLEGCVGPDEPGRARARYVNYRWGRAPSSTPARGGRP